MRIQNLRAALAVLAGLFFSVVAGATAQVPVGWVQVSATNQMNGGALVASGTVNFYPVNNSIQPLSLRVAGGTGAAATATFGVGIISQTPGSGYSGSWTCTVVGGTYSSLATCTATVSSGGLVFAIPYQGQYTVAPTGITFTGGTYTAGSPASAVITLGVSGTTVTEGGSGYAGTIAVFPSCTTQPTSTVTVSGGAVVGFTASGGICPTSSVVSILGSGQVGPAPFTATVTNGVWSILVPDTVSTFPANPCYNIIVVDNASGQTDSGPGYSCVQPAGSGTAVSGGADWCTAQTSTAGGTCNFDIYPPNLSANVTVQTGPVGPTGPTGPTGATGAGGNATLTSGSSGQLTQVTGSTTFAGISGTSVSGSGTSQVVTYPGQVAAYSVQVNGASSAVALSSNGGIYQNMGTTANEQTLWGSRVGIAIPVPYVMPTGTAKNIAFDVVPLAGATNFSSSTGEAWVDICDGGFSTPCNQSGTVNYETIRLGILSTGDGFLSSEAGGTGTIHNLFLQNSFGNVMIGSEGTTEPAWPLVVAETTNPAIQLTDGTGTNSCYLSKVSSSNAFISGAAANDQIDRCTGGNMLFGSNSSTPGPTLEITPGAPGTVESFGNLMVLDPHGHASAETHASSDCVSGGGITTVNTGGAVTSTALSCLPAYAWIDSIGYIITTAITTATSFTVGDSGSATRYSSCQFSGGAQSMALGATGDCDAGQYKIGGTALPVQLTFNTTPGAGVVRIIVKYHIGVPPAS